MRNASDSPFRVLRAAALVAVLLAPVAVVSTLTWRYYVPIPFQDDWSLANLISADSVSIRALFAQHNEHVCFFPKLIFTVLARSTRWNQLFEPVLNILVVLTSLVALVLLSRTENQRSPVPFLIAGFASSVFLFSPAQFDVWLWPWMMTSTITTCLLCLAAFSLGRCHRYGFGLATACCAIASLSTAQGLFTWIALAPAAAWSERSRRFGRRRLVAWIVASVASWSVYFLGYESGGTMSMLAGNLSHPLSMAEFVLTVVGAPWIRDESLAAVVGAIQILLFVWVGVIVSRRQTGRALAVSGIGVWVVLFGAASAAGRLQYGIDTALTSRYLASSAILPAAFFVMVAILAERRTRASLRLGVASMLAVSMAWLSATHESLPAWRSASLDRQRGAACLGMLDQTGGEANNCLELISQMPDQMIIRAKAIEAAGVRDFRRAEPVEIERIAAPIGRISPRVRIGDSDLVEITGQLIHPIEAPGPGLVFLDAGTGRLWCCGLSDPLRSIESSNATGFRRAVPWSAIVPRDFVEVGDIVAYALLWKPDRLVPLEGVLRAGLIGDDETVYSGPQWDRP